MLYPILKAACEIKAVGVGMMYISLKYGHSGYYIYISYHHIDLQKKKKEIHDKTMKFENYATLPSVSYCLSLLQTLLIAGCIVFLAFHKSE